MLCARGDNVPHWVLCGGPVRQKRQRQVERSVGCLPLLKKYMTEWEITSKRQDPMQLSASSDTFFSRFSAGHRRHMSSCPQRPGACATRSHINVPGWRSDERNDIVRVAECSCERLNGFQLWHAVWLHLVHENLRRRRRPVRLHICHHHKSDTRQNNKTGCKAVRDATSMLVNGAQDCHLLL